jgi:hypothetical protein
MEFGFSELGIVGAAMTVSFVVMVGYMHYRMKRKEKFILFRRLFINKSESG